MRKDEIFVIDCEADSCKEAIKAAGTYLYRKGYVKENFVDECLKREEIYPTGLPTIPAVAIPHCGSQFVNVESMCLLRLPKAVTFHRIDDYEQTVETSLVFNLALKNDQDHVVFLQKFIAALSEEGGSFAKVCMEKNQEDVVEAFEKYQII